MEEKFLQRRIKSVGKWKRSSCNVESSRWASGREVLATPNQVGGQVEEKFFQQSIKKFLQRSIKKFCERSIKPVRKCKRLS